MDGDGLHHLKKGEGDELQRTWVSAPFEVLGRCRAPDGRGWGRLLRWADPDGRVQTATVGDADLFGEPATLAARLADSGLLIHPARASLLRSYIAGAETDQRATLVNRTGWHGVGTGAAFVLPDRAIGGRAGETVLFSSQSATAAFASSGDLDQWRAAIATPAAAHPRLAFAIATAFAGPMLTVAGRGEGFIVNLFGPSSIGKTTALAAAASVWGRGARDDGGFIRSWRTTANALEAIAAAHSDALLALDELGVVDGRKAGSAVYSLANGAGKGRSRREGSAREPFRWRSIILSTGEAPMSAKLRERGGRATAGQGVRALDVPADAGADAGIFAGGDGAALSAAFQVAARESYGVAGPAFVAQIVGSFELHETEARAIGALFVEEALTGAADGQTRRVAEVFGLIAAAAELARDVTGWAEGLGYDATRAAFAAWREQRGEDGPAEMAQAIRQVRAIIEQHGESRFRQLDNGQPIGLAPSNQLGYWREWPEGRQWLIPTETWKETFCDGLDPAAAAKARRSAGLLTANHGLRFKVRVEGKARDFYAVTSAIFANEGEASAA